MGKNNNKEKKVDEKKKRKNESEENESEESDKKEEEKEEMPKPNVPQSRDRLQLKKQLERERENKASNLAIINQYLQC